jgi:hypothetical protein
MYPYLIKKGETEGDYNIELETIMQKTARWYLSFIMAQQCCGGDVTDSGRMSDGRNIFYLVSSFVLLVVKLSRRLYAFM